MPKTWDELSAELAAAKVRAAGLPRPLGKMHAAHGRSEGHRCGDCMQFVRVHGDHAVKPFKCVLYGITNSAASDWRKKWPACGKFAQREVPHV